MLSVTGYPRHDQRQGAASALWYVGQPLLVDLAKAAPGLGPSGAARRKLFLPLAQLQPCCTALVSVLCITIALSPGMGYSLAAGVCQSCKIRLTSDTAMTSVTGVTGFQWTR